MPSKKDDTANERDLGIEEEALSTSQEAVPIPLVIGTRRVAVQWVMMPVITKTVKADTAGKK